MSSSLKFKKKLSIFIIFCNICSTLAKSDVDVTAKSAILICADSCDVIWEKSPNMNLAMASTTKIMTSLLALETAAAKGNKTFEITNDIVNVEGSSMGLQIGDIVTLEDLACGMLLPSGNDAANAAAISISGNIDEFIKLMNERAVQIGMKNTVFRTPSGLDLGNHHSTAYDMAILGAYAMENEQFENIVKKRNETLVLGNGRKIFIKNHNKLLKIYKNCIGIKTGFTKLAGRCLVSCAEENGVKLVTVTLNAPDDWNDHVILYNYGFKNTINKIFDDTNFKKIIKVNNGEKNEVELSSSGIFSRTFKSNIKDTEIIKDIIIPESIDAPISKGQIVGKIIYYHEGRKIGENPITSNFNINKKKKLNFFEKIMNFFKKKLKNQNN